MGATGALTEKLSLFEVNKCLKVTRQPRSCFFRLQSFVWNAELVGLLMDIDIISKKKFKFQIINIVQMTFGAMLKIV